MADYWSHPVLPSHREARKEQKGKKQKGAREDLNPGPLSITDLRIQRVPLGYKDPCQKEGFENKKKENTEGSAEALEGLQGY